MELMETDCYFQEAYNKRFEYEDNDEDFDDGYLEHCDNEYDQDYEG